MDEPTELRAPLTDAQRAYLPGLLDGEGHVAINVVRRRDCIAGFVLVPEAGISNTNLERMETLARQLELEAA